MLVFRGTPDQATTSTVLTIGNFDGLHRGHRALLDRLTAHARSVALPAAVLTFEPHPREFFAPEQAPARLTSLREKLNLLENCGIAQVYVCRFNARLATLSVENFIEDILVRGLSVRHLIIGDDFHFGKGRRGDFAMLQQAGQEHRFGVEAMHAIDWEGERVSSSAVRDALEAGDLEHAARLLGRPYSISGRIEHGEKVGRQLGFPTANVQLKRKRLPLEGIFAVTLSGVAEQPLPGAASLGVRPTLGAGLKPVLEVHLLDFESSIYGAHVTVNFLHKLRDEAKFDGLVALKAQIAKDVAATRTYFLNMKNG
ncbi:MAG: bifunctional riboflavin kinase/FAD synthetase [Betaproteobacteria bacterium]|nr:bifunctional riboflavin kinase/FAD synthetase [Betaproteobacteria bacterium]